RAYLASFILAAVLVEIPPGDAVLHRDDRGVGAAEMLDVAGDRRDLMRLDGQQHDVLLARIARALDRTRVRPLRGDLGAVFPDHAHALRANGVEVRAACDERDVFASRSKPSAEVAADRSRADDRDSSHNCRSLASLGMTSARDD